MWFRNNCKLHNVHKVFYLCNIPEIASQVWCSSSSVLDKLNNILNILFPLSSLCQLQTVSVSQHWERAHRYPCDNAPCTGVVCSSPEIVTVGEDGRIIVFRADQEGVIRVIGKTRINTRQSLNWHRIIVLSRNQHLQVRWKEINGIIWLTC